MTLLEFIKSKIIGPLVTNLICMSWFRWPFEDLNDVASFQLSRAENIRIPVQDCNNKALVRNETSFFYNLSDGVKILKDFRNQNITIFHIFQRNDQEIGCWFIKPTIPISNTLVNDKDNNKAGT